MNKKQAPASCLVALLAGGMFITAGCGDSAERAVPQVQTPSRAAADFSVSGRVLRNDGAPASGFTVSLQDRSTDQVYSVPIASDGSYRMQVPDGVYDASLDDSDSVDLDEEQTDDEACLFVGPVKVSGDLRKDFAIPADNGLDPGRIWGRVTLSEGLPAANRRIVLQSLTATSRQANVPAQLPDQVETVTDGEGRFDTSLRTSQGVGLNLVIYNEDGSEDEFVDINKAPGALYVEMATDESEVENTSSVTEDRSSPSAELALETSQQSKFTIRSDGGFFTTFEARGGLVRLGQGEPRFTDLISNIGEIRSRFPTLFSKLNDPIREIAGGPVEQRPIAGYPRFGLAENSKIFGYRLYDYVINLHTNGPVTLRFYDESGDSYVLRAITARDHTVKYNSSKPNINGFDITP